MTIDSIDFDKKQLKIDLGLEKEFPQVKKTIIQDEYKGIIFIGIISL